MSKTRLVIPLDDTTQIGIRDAEGLPLVLAIRADGIDIELVLPHNQLKATRPAIALAERSSVLATKARDRASTHTDPQPGASHVRVR